MSVPTSRCSSQKKIPAKRKSKSETTDVKRIESHQSRKENENRYERVKCCAPNGFHELLQKVTRAVILSRPVHMYRFIADMLDVELAQRTFDDIMYGCMLKKSKILEPYPTASCQLVDSFLRQTKVEIFGKNQFTMGPIPDRELERPALDRYRDYAGIGVFDMTCCEAPPEPQPIQTEVQCQPAEAEPVKPPLPPAKMHVFDKGPIPDYDMQEPAVDRYRDYAGIQPFELAEDECVAHTPLCRCTFCAMNEGLKRPISVFDDSECTTTTPQDDPMNVFVDSPVYREQQIRDEDTYKGVDFSATEPFGQLFQKEKQFQEDVFEPVSPYGERTFTQEHPLFGDFGVKCAKSPAGDQRGGQLVESAECKDLASVDDPDDGLGQQQESMEFKDPIEENDPDVATPGTGQEGLVEDVFDDKAFDEQPPEENPYAFAKEDFVTDSPEQATEVTEEGTEHQRQATAEATDANPD